MGAARRAGRHRHRKVDRKAGLGRQSQRARGGRNAAAAAHRSQRSASALSQLTAGVAMATATALTVSQVPAPTPPRAEVRVIDTDVNLAAASIANIPLNLLIDLINIPHSELQAFDLFAQAQLWGGNWLVTGPSNIWGTDPADAVRFMAAAAMAIPIPALSGLDPDAPLDADNPLGVLAGNGLAQKFWRFWAAEFPVDPNCDAEGCVPTTPTAPITGITGIDRLIWNVLMFTGLVDFPMIGGFFKVGLSELINGSYGPVEGPSGKINNIPGFNIPGTIDGPNGQNFLPWAGTPIDFDLVEPFVNYLNHLMADPADNPIKLPSLEQLGRTLQTLVAGLVVGFDPYTPGSPLCWGYCPYVPASQDYPAIVKFIGDLWPGNEKIDAWLEAYDQGIANTPMGDYIAGNINLFRLAESWWDFSNKPLDPQFVNMGFNPSDLAPAFYNMWKMLGYDPDPLYPDGDTTTGVPTPVGAISGVYALKGIQLAPFPFLMESDQWIEDKAATYVGDLTDLDTSNVNNVPWWEPSDMVGKWTLTNAIGDDPSPTIFGYSRGAFVAGEWKKDFNEFGGVDGVKPSFVLIGNPLRPNGGSSVRIDPFWTATRGTPTETAGADPGQITTRDIAYQYDFFADTPTNMLNPISMTNWALGIVNHLFYPDDPQDKAVLQDRYGDTEYYLIPSETVPLLYPVQWLPVVGPALADILDPVARVLVESGYNRTISPGQPTATNLLYFPDPVEFVTNLSVAVATGLDNGFEQMGMGRLLGTTRPDTTGQGAYGIGGPPVTMDDSGDNSAGDDAAGNDAAGNQEPDATVRLAGLGSDRSREGQDKGSGRSDGEAAVVDSEQDVVVDEENHDAVVGTDGDATDEGAGDNADAGDADAGPDTDSPRHTRHTDKRRDAVGGGRHARVDDDAQDNEKPGSGTQAGDDGANGSDTSGEGKHARSDDNTSDSSAGDDSGSENKAA